MKKKWYFSKTLWSNLILGVIAVAVPKVGEVLNAESMAMLFGVVNLILRATTKHELV